MEKIKVNMNPNPLDVQTIHASQNDGEARQWEFELHNNGELIDTSEITEQLFFKAYKGGTEQILPENTSTPTTSPFKGDIKYPQGLLTDQEFLYRESPTEEDGLAKITDIKGNTLVWNQLVRNGNFPSKDTSIWRENNASTTVSNNVLSFTATQGSVGVYQSISGVTGHKYLLMCTINTTDSAQVGATQLGSRIQVTTGFGAYQTVLMIGTASASSIVFAIYTSTSRSTTVNAKNAMLFDLTQMGLDITDPSEFTSLFSLPYYAYNQGTLLSFMGNGIKTTGKNILPYSGENLPYNANGVSITRENNIYKVVATNPSGYPFARISTIHYLPKGQYTVTMLGAESSNRGIAWRLIDRNVSPVKIFVNSPTATTALVLNEDAHDVYFEITIDASRLATGTWDVRFQLNMGLPSEYEPYTSSTLSLPISTYFPTGMKSAGTVYDELTPTKGITRIGAVDLGSLNWTYDSSVPRFKSLGIVSAVAVPSSNSNIANIKCAVYDSISLNGLAQSNKCIAVSAGGIISVKDTAYTSASAFKSSLSGVYLYYELATETETPITTASLVTENGEIPLSNEDGVLVGKCTEQLSENPGFIDAKIKLSDSDGDCYSNKLQLHVERSPQ